MSITKLTTNGLTGSKYDTASADNYYMEPIATTLVGGTAVSSITFTGIPATYKHLQVRYLARTSRSAGSEDLIMQFNSDTGSNYSTHYVLSAGSGTPAAGGASTQTFMYIPTTTSSTATTSIFGVGVVDILDYANTSKYKTMRALGGEDRNGSGTVALESGLWQNTSTISAVTLKTISSNNFVEYSRFSLYGIRG
jgi:hypothetical protein